MKVLMCVTNISEGKNEKLISEVREAILATADVKLLEVSTDRDHNRSVYSYLGAPEKVLEATEKLAEISIRGIDMTTHKGDHPRMGAVDVVPFIPVRDIKTEEAVEIARQFGHFLGGKGVPVYYYEDAATSAERKNLVRIRKGQYEALPGKLADPSWAPDEGPAQFNPQAGATAVGVRLPLIALNVNFHSVNLDLANTIARSVRHLNGGLRYVRAIGVYLSDRGMVQVSMNLTNYRETPIHRVMEAVRSEASRYGLAVASAELVGPVPLEAMEDLVRFYVQVHDFSAQQIIETNLLQ